jgi:hypothetical protein
MGIATQVVSDVSNESYMLPNWSQQTAFIAIGPAISLALLCVQTFVAAAAVAPEIWASPITVPTITTAIMLTSTLRNCGLGIVLIIVFATTAVLQTLTYPGKMRNKAFTETLLASSIFQVFLFLSSVSFGIFTCIGVNNISTLVVRIVLVAATTLPSASATIWLLVQVFQSFYETTPEEIQQHTPENQPPRPITVLNEPGAPMTAFYTTEAKLFRSTSQTANWAPKKSH